MQNPFTTTYSKIPASSYIPTEQVEEILQNFTYEQPSESVYKITGVRGSGKTVLLASVEQKMESEEMKQNGWYVYRLSPARDMLRQLLSFLARDGIIKEKKKDRGANVSATILGTGGGIGITSSADDLYTDVGVELDAALKNASAEGKKILIGVDEVSRTQEMIVFTQELGGWIRAGYPVYLVCTGLYENIEQLYNVKNLTFFRRATTVKTEPLSQLRMSEVYRKTLGTDTSVARQLAEMTKGYAYAFQKLGSLAFQEKTELHPEELAEDLRSELFAYAYEKIWEEMSTEDRALVSLLLDQEEYKKEEVVSRMEKPQNCLVYRDRLLRRGILKSRQGYIGLALPYFADYIKEYGGVSL